MIHKPMSVLKKLDIHRLCADNVVNYSLRPFPRTCVLETNWQYEVDDQKIKWLEDLCED